VLQRVKGDNKRLKVALEVKEAELQRAKMELQRAKMVMKHVPCHVKKHVLYQPGSARDKAVVTLEIRMCMLDGASGSCNSALWSVSQ